MPPTRRTFLQQASSLGLLWSARQTLARTMNMATPQQHAKMLHSLELTPFVDALPLPPVLHATSSGKPLRIVMREIHARVHRDVPPTRMWSYGETALGPLVEARAHHPLQIEWVNSLPTQHFLPIDHSLHGCGRDIPDVRAIAHMHGARVPTRDDGHPEDWFVPGKSLTCHYPLQQEAAALWYHDHAMGLNRLNVYAGLFGMMLIRDEAEDALRLPSGPYEIPLMLYDRDFTVDGQLHYPDSGDPEHPWMPEFYADAILINGKIRPYLEVEPRVYRFRVVNVANSRFFQLSLAGANAGQGIANALPFHQIGTDQGLLARPVELKHSLLAPAERADLLVDFRAMAGQKLHLRNGGLEILEFRVGEKRPAASYSLPKTLRAIAPADASAAILTRTITLGEKHDHLGNPMLMLLDGKRWHEPVTERPRLNTTEIWEFVNLTEDTHPMHLHLVRFRILDRRLYDVYQFQMRQGMRYIAPATPPEPHEDGWKDVVQCPPGIVTRILVKFEGYTGDYLYHCHILEHEANDMMRPFEVIA